MNNENVWVIDDDKSIRWVLEKAFRKSEIDVITFETADEALEAVRANAIPPDAVISDIRMPGSDGLSFLSSFKQTHPHVPVLIMTAFSDLDTTVSSFEQGAFEYIPKPFDVDEVIAQTRKACAEKFGKEARTKSPKRARGVEDAVTPAAQSDFATNAKQPELIGDAPAMQEVFKAIGRLSRSKITVLINGESGSGKELIAQALHRHSPRACLLYTSPSPRDATLSRMPSSA